MNAKIRYSAQALDDLEAIWNYLAVDCDNARAAQRIVGDIMNRVDRLADMPESGQSLDSQCIIHSNYRFLAVGRYVAFYRYENNCISIDRVLDSRSDFLKKLFGFTDSSPDFYAN